MCALNTRPRWKLVSLTSPSERRIPCFGCISPCESFTDASAEQLGYDSYGAGAAAAPFPAGPEIGAAKLDWRLQSQQKSPFTRYKGVLR